jgi:hypothetical protein
VILSGLNGLAGCIEMGTHYISVIALAAGLADQRSVLDFDLHLFDDSVNDSVARTGGMHSSHSRKQ